MSPWRRALLCRLAKKSSEFPSSEIVEKVPAMTRFRGRTSLDGPWAITWTTDWFQIGKGECQGYILSPRSLNFYVECIMQNAGLDEAQAGIARRNINNLRYADDTTLRAESQEELKDSWWKWDKSEKAGLKLNIQKTKIMTSSPITSWQIDGETMETPTDFIFSGSKITANDGCSHEVKRCLLLGRKAMTNLAAAAAAAAKSLQSCPTLCDRVPGILQARTLKWVAISFSNAWKWKVKVKSLRHVWLLESSSRSQGISLKGWTVSAGYVVASDSNYRTTCLFQASGFLLYFDKSIRSEVWHF